MKNLIAIIALILLSVSFTSCKKTASPSPTPPASSTPPAPTSTGTPMYFNANLNFANYPLVTYHLDATNTKVYLNSTEITNAHTSFNGSNMISITNVYGSTVNPIMMNHGDVLKLVINNLPYSADLTYGFNPNHLSTFKVYSDVAMLSQKNSCCDKIWDIGMPNTTATDTHLGIAMDNINMQTYDWYLGRSFTVTYTLP